MNTIKHLQTDENDGIVLCPNDHQDLMTILETLMPGLPANFKILIESQILSANCGDSRAMRWKPAMISLCLNLWAKYVFHRIVQTP